MRRHINRVVGVNPAGERFEREASNSEVMLGWGRWGWAALLTAAASPVEVEGYTVWIDR